MGLTEPASSTRVDIYGMAYLALDYRRFAAPLTARSRLSPRFRLAVLVPKLLSESPVV